MRTLSINEISNVAGGYKIPEEKEITQIVTGVVSIMKMANELFNDANDILVKFNEIMTHFEDEPAAKAQSKARA